MSMMVNPYRFASGGGGGGAEYEYVTTVTVAGTVNANIPRTFSAVDIGDAHDDREVVVVFSARTSLISSVSAFTIDGIAATQVVGMTGNAGGQITMYRAADPAGTTADIVVTLNQPSSDGTIHVYRVVPATSAVPLDSGNALVSSTQAVTVPDIAVESGGFLIVGAIESLNAGLTPTYNGVDTPVSNFASVVNSRSRLTWSAAITETVGTNDPGATKPASSGTSVAVVAASWH